VADREGPCSEAREPARGVPRVTGVLTGPRGAEALTLPYAHREARGNFTAEHRQAIEQVAPPSILVDEAHRVLNVSETAGRFLLQPAGPISSLAADLVR